MHKLLIQFYNTSKWLGGNRVGGVNQCLWRNLRTPGKLGIAQSSPLTFICEIPSKANSGERSSKCVGFKCKREREFDHTELFPVSKICLVFHLKFTASNSPWVLVWIIHTSCNRNLNRLSFKFERLTILIWNNH